MQTTKRTHQQISGHSFLAAGTATATSTPAMLAPTLFGSTARRSSRTQQVVGSCAVGSRAAHDARNEETNQQTTHSLLTEKEHTVDDPTAAHHNAGRDGGCRQQVQ